MDKYIEVYSILYDLAELTKEEYYQLNSIYGSEVVSSVIEDLVAEDETNLEVFKVHYESRYSKLLYKRGFSFTSYTAYRADITSIPCLDDEKNSFLMLQISDVIKKLNEIFIILDCDDSVFKSCKTPWIEDKVQYCLNICTDLVMLDKLSSLFEKYIQLKDIVINGNLRLVTLIASEYSASGLITFDDIVQWGNIGLMRTVEKYNPTKGSTFSSYASINIHSAILNNIASLNYSMGLTRYIISQNRQILEVMSNLSVQYGREVKYEEAAIFLGKSVDWIQRVMIIFSEPLFLDKSLESDVECLKVTYKDLIEDKNSSVYDIVYDNYLSKVIKRTLENTLTERQLFVILNYFGFEGNYSIPVIASMLGVTRQATDQLMKNALKKLKKKTNIMEFATD